MTYWNLRPGVSVCPTVAVVDSAGVAGLFNAIDRIADATGAPLEKDKAEMTAELREAIGINEFAATKKVLEEHKIPLAAQ